MPYYFLLTVDEYGEPTGCVYFDTPGGRVIVLFQNEGSEQMHVIADHAVNSMPRLHSVRSAYLEVSSFEEAARELDDSFPELCPIVFLTDNHPFVIQLVASLRNKGGISLIRVFRR